MNTEPMFHNPYEPSEHVRIPVSAPPTPYSYPNRAPTPPRPFKAPRPQPQPQAPSNIVFTVGVLWTSKWGVPVKPVPAGTEGQLVRTFTNDDGVQCVHVRVPQGLIVCQSTRVRVR